MSEETNSELDPIMDAMVISGLSVLKSASQRLMDRYVEEGLTEHLAQNQMLIALSTVTGSLIACMEKDYRDFVEQKIVENINHWRVRGEQASGEVHNTAEDPNGLAHMTPEGSC